MFNFRIVFFLLNGKVEETVNSRVTDDPIQSLQDMPFHLYEHVILVESAAHGLQLFDRWNTILPVAIFGGY